MAEVKIIISAEDKNTQSAFSAVSNSAKSAFDSVKTSAQTAGKGTQDAFTSVSGPAQTAFSSVSGSAHTAFSGVSNAVQSAGERIGSVFRSIQTNWMAVAGVVGSMMFLRNMAIEAYESEKVMNRLKTQVEGLGIVYSSVSVEINSAIQATSRYASVTGGEVADVLQQLTFYSGDHAESMKHMNLVYDFAEQKGIGVATAADLIGKAMSGNVEMLGRYIPELRNINEVLGEHATETEKSAYAFALLEEKSAGAMSKMTENEKIIREGIKAWKDLKEAIGNVIMTGLSYSILGVKEMFTGATRKRMVEEALEGLSLAVHGTADIMKIETGAVRESGEAHQKTKEQIIQEGKARSDAIDTAIRQVEFLKRYSNIAKTLGADVMKFAEMDFAIKISKSDLNDIKIAMEDYGNTVDSVYNRQLEKQRALNKALEVQKTILEDQQAQTKYIESAAKAITDQSLLILETEKKHAEMRLGMWSSYYDKVTALYAQSVEEGKKKIQEMLEFEKQVALQRQGFAEIEKSLYEKAWGGQAKSAVETYYGKQTQLEQEYQAALLLGGQLRIDALARYQQSAASAAQAVVEDGREYVSLQTAAITALDQVRRAQAAIVVEQDKIAEAKKQEIEQIKEWEASLASAMADAQSMIAEYRSQIIDLGNQMQDLRILVDSSQALTAVNEVKAAIDAIPDVTVKTLIFQTTGIGGVMDASGVSISSAPGFRTGTPYVERDMLAYIHEGEAVVPKEYNIYSDRQSFAEIATASGPKTVTITMGDVKIVANGSDTPESLAKKLVKPIRDELWRLQHLQ